MSQKTTSIPRSQRAISLAMYLSGRGAQGASKLEIENNVEGYSGLSSGADDVRKLLDRDIDALREMGLHVARVDERGNIVEDKDSKRKNLRLRFDTQKSYAKEIQLNSSEAMLLRLASMTPLGDPSFLYRDELLSAATKLSDILGTDSVLPSSHAPANAKDEREQADARKIDSAITHRKELRFSYVDSHGKASERAVRPGLLFAIGGDWYLLAVDSISGQEREFRVSRLSHLEQKNKAQTPDFEPLDMDIRDHIGFPFQYGNDEPFCFRFLMPKNTRQNPQYLWERTDRHEIPGMPGYLLVSVEAQSLSGAASWLLSYAPGLVAVSPPALSKLVFDALHGMGGEHA